MLEYDYIKKTLILVKLLLLYTFISYGLLDNSNPGPFDPKKPFLKDYTHDEQLLFEIHKEVRVERPTCFYHSPSSRLTNTFVSEE